MADYYTLLTNAGIAYENACKVAGVPIKLSQISVGDGGGAVYNPAATATALKREVWRGPLNALFQDDKNPSWLLAEVTIPPEVGGWYVREAGIWTDTGILYAVVKYPESFKPVLATSGSGKEFYIRSIFETSNASDVTLLIDDNIVKATRAWVAGYVADELAKLDGKRSVRAAALGNIVLSGLQQVDSVALLAGDRVLVPKQTVGKDNGIYVAAVGAWVRATDADNGLEVTPGLFVSVEEGAVNGDSVWQLVTDAPIVLGTTALTFEVVAGRTGIAASTYRSLTVDKLGRVIAGTNPTTLAGYQISDAYKRTDVDLLLSGKANNAITLAGYGIGDAYTKTAVDTLLAEKAAKGTTLAAYGITDGYTKTETNTFLNSKVSIASSGISGVAPLITGPLAAVPSSQLFSAVSPGTTDTPPSYPNTVGMHFIFANTSFGADIGISLNDNIGNLLFRNLGPNSSGWRKVWHDGNFNLSSKISATACSEAGFASSSVSAPFMRHTDGTVVMLQVDRPKDTANFSPSGFSKNADTGEIIQRMEVAIGDIPSGGRTIDITWPFAFPNAFVHVTSIVFRSADATVRHVSSGYYSMGTVNGCRLQIDEAAQVVQPSSLTAIVTALGR